MALRSRPRIERTPDWTYKVEGIPEPLPSVTTIIQKTVPKELAWWGMTVGCDGVVELMRNGQLTCPPYWTGSQLVGMLNERKLTVNHRLSNAGARGMAIHAMLEDYGKDGRLQDRLLIDPAYHGYADALIKWLMDNHPEFIRQEVMTASLQYGYAGTYDVVCIFKDGKHKGKLALVDLKTSKQIYKDQYFPQVEAYEQAEVELGESPTDIRLVVLLKPDGKYTQAVSTYDFSDFKVLLDHYKAIQRRKVRK